MRLTYLATMYILTKKEEQAIKSWLMGNLTYRELGKAINMSHQGAVNAVSNVCKQWVKQGKLEFKDD